MQPMLPTTMSQNRLLEVCADPDWVVSEKCITWSTKVLTDSGFLGASYVREGMRLVGSDGHWHRVLELHRSVRGERQLVKIHSSGQPTSLTVDHQMLTSSGWKPAGEVVAGDWLVIPRPRPDPEEIAPSILSLTFHAGYTKEIPVTEDLLWMLGYYVGDGSADKGNNDRTRGRIAFAVNRRDTHVVERLKKTLASIGIEPRAHENREKKQTYVFGVDTPFAYWLNDNFRRRLANGHLRDSRSKTIPSWFDGLSDELFVAFSDGWCAADGYLTPGGQMSACTVSRHLSGLIWRQALMRGIPMSVNEGPTQWEYLGEKRQSTAYTLRWLRSERFLKWDGDRWLTKVTKIELLPRKVRAQMLFDFTLEDVHDYVTGSTIHNCNGHRLVVEFDRTRIHGFARNGNRVDIPVRVMNALAPLGRSETTGLFLDGELITTAGIARYHVFDVVMGGDLPFGVRWDALASIADSLGWNDPDGVVQIVPIVGDTIGKAKRVQCLIRTAAEGVIARDVTKPYEGGRSKYCRKYKFLKTIDAIVMDTGRDGKDNLVLGVYDGGRIVEIGAVSAQTGDGPMVRKNDVVEITYLTVSPDRRLIQPVTPRLRRDKDARECTVDQLLP